MLPGAVAIAHRRLCCDVVILNRTALGEGGIAQPRVKYSFLVSDSQGCRGAANG